MPFPVTRNTRPVSGTRTDRVRVEPFASVHASRPGDDVWSWAPTREPGLTRRPALVHRHVGPSVVQVHRCGGAGAVGEYISQVPESHRVPEPLRISYASTGASSAGRQVGRTVTEHPVSASHARS